MGETKKPRLCEILGVEVGERFRAKGYDGDLVINENGTFSVLGGDMRGASFAIFAAIEHPENVVHKFHLTEQELAICKAVGAEWVTLDQRDSAVCVTLWAGDRPSKDEGLYISYDIEKQTSVFLAQVSRSRFPSVKLGDCIKVEEC